MQFKKKPFTFYETSIFLKSNKLSLLSGTIFKLTLLYSNKFQIKTQQLVYNNERVTIMLTKLLALNTIKKYNKYKKYNNNN